MIQMIFLICLIMIIYMIFPNYYYRNVSKNIIKRLICQDNKIALTFDDGPNKKYTQLLLDVLQENQIKCTFFVLAENAEANRDIIQRMIKEGHTIGIHSLRHKSAWLSTPFETKRDFNKALKIMDSLGVKVRYFRPPWGTFNIFTCYFARRNNLKTILWSINARDWSKRTSVEDIRDKLFSYVVPGDIIVLHDNNGAENAPLRTIKALEEVLPALKNKGFEFIALESLECEQIVGDSKKIIRDI